MEFDPSSANNFNYLSSIFPENSCKNYEIPTLVPMQPNSNLSPNPSQGTNVLYHGNENNFKQPHLNAAKNCSNFCMEGSSSSSQFCMIPTPSFQSSSIATHTSGSMTDFLRSRHPMGFSPNNYQTDVIHDYINSGINYLDLINSNPLPYNAIFQSQVDLSFSPLFYNDEPRSVPVNHMLQDELSHNVGSGKSLPDTDLILDVDDQKKQCWVEMKNNESYQSDTSIIKGTWAADEDRILKDLVNEYGRKNWSKIAKFIYGRNEKQCRKRWINHLQPNIRKDSWSEDEEKILIEGHKLLGNKWEKISRRLPGRAENTLKNHWNNIKQRVNVKRKRNGGKNFSNGTLLEKYIQEVTNANAD